MAPLTLTVRTSPRDSFPLEIEDDETVEALAVVIFSLKPDLGEELRLAHKGKPLKEDVELRAAGVRSGDVIAVAKKVPRPAPVAEAAPAAAAGATSGPGAAPSGGTAAQAAPPEQPEALAQRAQDGPAAGGEAASGHAAKLAPPAVPAPASPAGEAASAGAGVAAAPRAHAAAATPMAAPASPPVAPAAIPKDSGHHQAEHAPAAADLPAAAQAPPANMPETQAAPTAAAAETELEEAAPPTAAAAETELEEAAPPTQDAPANAPAEAATEAPAEAAVEAAVEAPETAPEVEVAAKVAEAGPAAAEPGSAAQQEHEEEEVTPDVLLAFARRLETGEADAHPAELARLLRRAAARMRVFDSTVGEAGHALQLVNHLSATVLRSMNASLQGLPSQGQDAHQGATKSFLLKRGDADVQEAHRLAALQRPSTGGGSVNSHSGGVLSSSSTPMTREAMDRARQARLQKLEQQQADKKKEQEEAAAKSRAKESMFDKPFVGPTRPLGKF